VLNVAVDGEPVKMRTCQITCMHDGRAPDYAPGHPLDIGACRSGPPLMPNPVAPAQVLERPLDLGERFAPKPVRSLDLR